MAMPAPDFTLCLFLIPQHVEAARQAWRGVDFKRNRRL
uniref:Uncharacterized protein n=1 Tax=Setaria viridis TaxID=4556 RepID=A0A4U6TTN3_SETVI|nr:hypothetical protein SEVIR_8G149600v2 [Setaria viridis]